MDHEIEIMEFLELLDLMDREVNRIGWSLDKFKQYVLTQYGKKSRYFLTDEQLWELLDFLRSQPDKSIIQLPTIGLRKI